MRARPLGMGIRPMAIITQNTAPVRRNLNAAPKNGSNIQAALGRLYVEDPRFSEKIDEKAPGLARFLSVAIAANNANR